MFGYRARGWKNYHQRRNIGGYSDCDGGKMLSKASGVIIAVSASVAVYFVITRLFEPDPHTRPFGYIKYKVKRNIYGDDINILDVMKYADLNFITKIGDIPKYISCPPIGSAGIKQLKFSKEKHNGSVIHSYIFDYYVKQMIISNGFLAAFENFPEDTIRICLDQVSVAHRYKLVAKMIQIEPKTYYYMPIDLQNDDMVKAEYNKNKNSTIPSKFRSESAAILSSLSYVLLHENMIPDIDDKTRYITGKSTE